MQTLVFLVKVVYNCARNHNLCHFLALENIAQVIYFSCLKQMQIVYIELMSSFLKLDLAEVLFSSIIFISLQNMFIHIYIFKKNMKTYRNWQVERWTQTLGLFLSFILLPLCLVAFVIQQQVEESFSFWLEFLTKSEIKPSQKATRYKRRAHSHDWNS